MDDRKYVLIVTDNNYVPYDVYARFRQYVLSIKNIMPKLNSLIIKESVKLDYDLLYLAYKDNYDDLNLAIETKHFIQEKVYSKENIEAFVKILATKIDDVAAKAFSYKDWAAVANMKAKFDVLVAENELLVNVEQIQQKFVDFILKEFGHLATAIDRDTPVLVNKSMEYMHDNSEKFAVIVMDGMSEFDWRVISEYFTGIKYEKSDAYAMIPTTTSISRQCLLSNKYPRELISPWRQADEKKEFIQCAKSMGFTDQQIGYERGYDASFGVFVKCAAVIVNEIDDTVHGQVHGREGMLFDMQILGKKHKLLELTKRLLSGGFDVYITADHGNAPCVGMGKLTKTGVDIETKSRRMAVLKEFADKEAIKERYKVIDFTMKYYLDKQYEYLICDVGRSFDAKDEEVMSHGGITIDEVIVPFIKIKAVENNG